ncbi:MAG TPA: response regulator, partial [Candidatus Solibacter sp.]|nr:response regulator [Candidatus Solibacter sp.]
HPDLPGQVYADPARIRQVLVNLLGNAIKFTGQGEVGLEVTADAREQDQILLHFAVRDTGIGIPMDKQRVIFEAFSQADGSTTRNFGGTGLGLTISSHLASLMHGALCVESNPGEGSCFRLSIPAGTMNGSPATPPAELAGLAGMPVLVVDDNGASRRILCEMLAHWEMRPVAAADGRETFLLLRNAERNQTPFAMALIDASMPGLDGFAFTEQIRHDPGLVGPIVLLMPLAPRPEDASRCREPGVDACLTKPVGRTGLWKALMKASGEAVERDDQPALAKRRDRQGPLRPLRVLVAEDNRVNQMVAVRLIEKRGHSVVVASNGREVLAAIERYHFDLVLMDAQMPEMDGFQATAAIREREKLTGGHLPIVALTAHAMAGDRERCLAAGMDHYVTKPIQPVQLFEAIEELTSTAPAFAPAVPARPEFTAP